jgi:hypothetical protein
MSNALTIALHIALLKIGGKIQQILVIRQDGVRLGLEKVVVPGP